MIEGIKSSEFKHSPTWLPALQAITKLVLAAFSLDGSIGSTFSRLRHALTLDALPHQVRGYDCLEPVHKMQSNA